MAERISRRRFLGTLRKTAIGVAGAGGLYGVHKALQPSQAEVDRFAQSIVFKPTGGGKMQVEFDKSLLPKGAYAVVDIESKHSAFAVVEPGENEERKWPSSASWQYVAAHAPKTTAGQSKAIVNVFSNTTHPKNVSVTLERVRPLGGLYRTVAQTKFRPRFGKFTHRGVDVFHEAELTETEVAKAREMVDEITLVRPLLKKVDLTELHLNKRREAAGDPEHSAAFVEHETDENKGIIIAQTNTLKTNQHRLVAFHEATHGVYINAEGSKQRRAFESFCDFHLGYAMRRVEERYQTDADKTIDHKRLEKTPHYAIFDESAYIGGNPAQGHPYSNANELFASTANVMRHFPTEFMKRAEDLRNLALIKKADFGFHPKWHEEYVDQKFADRLHVKTLKVALLVTRIFGKEAPKIFDKKLLDYIEAKRKELKLDEIK